MIQRIQSIFLLLTFIVSVIFLCGVYFYFLSIDGTSMMMDFNGLWKTGINGELVPAERMFFLTVIFILIALLSFVSLFLFKNLRLQVFLAKVLVFLSFTAVIFSVYLLVIITGRYNVTISPGLRMVIPPLVLIFSLLAYRGIKRDQKLLRDYDRLR